MPNMKSKIIDASYKCYVGDGKACYELAIMYYDGNEYLKQNFHAGDISLENSCRLGYVNGCALLGMLLIIRENKVTRARELLMQGCNDDISVSCYFLASSYDNETDGDLSQAIKYYTKSCENTSTSKSCVKLGTFYENGKGVEKNLEKAGELYLKACALTKNIGCNEYKKLSKLEYKSNEELYADVSTKYLTKACENGRQEACESLAKLYYYGYDSIGIKQDSKKAHKFWQMACSLNAATCTENKF